MINVNFVQNKKAAMFGLDARIALAIFGALSVISGAALYSAIQQAKLVQWQTLINEVTKAEEAFYLDMGYVCNSSHRMSCLVDKDYVISNMSGASNYKGPYMSSLTNYSIQNSLTREIGDTFGIARMRNLKRSTWLDHSSIYCDTNSDCTYFFILTGGDIDKKIKLFNLLDKKIDNGDGNLAGSIRATDTYASLLIKGPDLPVNIF